MMERRVYGKEVGVYVVQIVREEGGINGQVKDTVKCMGIPLYQMDDEWMTVRCNVKHERRVWGQLGKILQREVAETQFFAVFYIGQWYR